MAYPSGILFKPKSSNIGFQPIDEATADARHPLGSTVVAEDVTLGSAVFKYLKGAADTAAGDLVVYDQSASTTLATTDITGPAAVAMSACAVGLYGWYCIEGKVPVKTPNAVASGGSVYPLATAGGVDDADTLTLLVSGANFKAADSGGFAYVQIARPTIQASPGAGAEADGGVLTLGAVGGAANANGGAIAGTVYTAAPASASFPGMQSAAHYSKIAAITYARWPKTVVAQPTSSAQSVGVVGRVYMGMIELQVPCRMDAIAVLSAMASPAGNIIVGLYGPIVTDDTALAAPLVAQSASTTLTATTGNWQVIPFTSATANLTPGVYYVAFEADATTVLVIRHSNNRETPGGWQYYDRGGGYGAFTDPVPALGGSNNANDNPVLRARCIATT
jgi:hypothetical protein